MIKVIFFDFDGVIVESIDIKTRAFNKLFEHEGDDVAAKVVNYHLNHTGISRFDKFRHIYREILNRPLTEKIFDDLCQRFSQLVVDEVIKAPYVKGAKEFLDKCTDKYKCFIASATPQGEIEEIIKKRQLFHYFNEIYGAPKKKTDIVRQIVMDYNLMPDDAIYVGDAQSDYQAAKENNITFILRLTSANDLLFRDIDCVKIQDLQNLQSVINSISLKRVEPWLTMGLRGS